MNILTIEFINLSEPILIKVEKKLCLWLREILESREYSRKYLNTFAVKPNARPIRDTQLLTEYAGLNSSYKILEHNLSTGKRHEMLMPLVHSSIPEMSISKKVQKDDMKIIEETKTGLQAKENTLVNKEFYCVQFGNDGGISANVATQNQRLFLGEMRRKG